MAESTGDDGTNPPEEDGSGGEESDGGSRRKFFRKGKQAAGKGTSPISSETVVNVNTAAPHHYLSWVIALFIFILIIIYSGAYNWIARNFGLSQISLFGMSIYVGTFLFFVYIIFGIISGAKKGDSTTIFVALALLIWFIDLAPPIQLGPFNLGGPFQGFNLDWKDLSKTVQTTWLLILTSSTMFALLYVDMVFNIIKKQYVSFGFGLLFIVATNKLSAYLFSPPLTIPFGIPWGNAVSLALVAIGLAVLAFFAYQRYGKETTVFASSLFMIFVFSFFWINNGWLVNIKAIFHVIFIMAFGFGYVAQREDEPRAWHILIPLFLIADFYGYGLLFGSGILIFKFIPILVIFVVGYCYAKTRNAYAITTVVVIITIILLLTLDAQGYTGSTLTFSEQKGGADLTEFINTLLSKSQTLVVNQIDYASGGYYKSLVENNQFELLGVYFDRVLASQPKFYTDEDVTIWANIKARTLSDPVTIDFRCFRYDSDKKRVEARRKENADDSASHTDYDVVIPNNPFEVFALEETDAECTFTQDGKTQSKLPAGWNTITLSAGYNFVTNAYQKLYFIDKNKMRALIRENIDPLRQFGIKDVNPFAVYTNGPVDVKINSQTLIPVSGDENDPKPFFGIMLNNRQETKDKAGLVKKWDGRIKRINELTVFLPDGLSLETDNCKPVSFKKFDRSDCFGACVAFSEGDCLKGCDNLEPDSQNQMDCIKVCNDKRDLLIKEKGDEVKQKLKNCEDDCTNLFRGDDVTGQQYQGFSLDVDKLYKSTLKDEFRDIDSNAGRNAIFGCRLVTTDSTKALDNTPVTTRFIRIRVRYDYLLEKTVDVLVEQAPAIEEREYPIPNFNLDVSDEIYRNLLINPNNAFEKNYIPIVLKSSKEHGVNYLFVKSIIQQESGWVPRKDPKGESFGLMQVTSSAANDKNVQCNADYQTNDISNIDCGVRYLRYLINIESEKVAKGEIGQTDLMNIAAAYNCGPKALDSDPTYGLRWKNPGSCTAKVNGKETNTREYVNSVRQIFQSLDQQLKKLQNQVLLPPDSPTAIDTPNAKRSITISWIPTTPDVEYGITRFSWDGQALGTIEPIKDKKYIDTTVDDGVTYYYGVYAISAEKGKSPYAISNWINSIDDTSNPAPSGTKTIIQPPLLVNAILTVGARNSITITWQPSTTTNVKYHIYRYKSAAQSHEAYFDTEQTSYVDAGLLDGAAYYYYVQAFADSGESEYAQSGTVAIPTNNDIPPI